jgi:hypothetical protein
VSGTWSQQLDDEPGGSDGRALVRRILDRPTRVGQADWHAAEALTLTYSDESGRPEQELQASGRQSLE